MNELVQINIIIYQYRSIHGITKKKKNRCKLRKERTVEKEQQLRKSNSWMCPYIGVVF